MWVHKVLNTFYLQLDVTTVNHRWLAKRLNSSLYNNEVCRLLFTCHANCKIPCGGGRTGSPLLIMVACALPNTTWHGCTAHLVHPNNNLYLWRVPRGLGRCHNDAAKAKMKNEKHLPPFFFPLTEAKVTHMTDFPGEWFAAKTISSDTETPCILHLYCTATHCSRGVFFSSQNRRDEERQCLPSWKCIPLGYPQHETNKHPPHDTLAIHLDLHGYVGCCQDSLSVQR